MLKCLQGSFFLAFVSAMIFFGFTSSTVDAKSLDGEALSKRSCISCHGGEKMKYYQKQKKDLAFWRSTVKRMISNGAVLTPEEGEAVAKYLASRSK